MRLRILGLYQGFAFLASSVSAIVAQKFDVEMLLLITKHFSLKLSLLTESFFEAS